MNAYLETGRLRPVAQDSTIPLLVIATTVVALCLGALLAVAGGGMTLLAVAGGILVVAALVRPVIGLYAAMLFTLAGNIHLGDPNYAAGSRLFTSIREIGVNLTPTELVLVCAAIGLFVRLVFDDEVRFRPGTLLLPIMLLMAAVALASAVGISRGADMAVLRQEVRGLVLLPILYLLITHFVTSQQQVTRLMWTFVLGANVMAAESIYRYFTQVRNGYTLDLSESLAFAHENSLLAAAAIVVLLARLVWTRNVVPEWKCLALMLLPLAAMLVMHRRAGMVALDGGVALLCVVLLREKVRTFLMVVPLAVLAFGAVLAVTWNNPGGSGEFARSFRAATGSVEVSVRDQSSNIYREREALNIRMNINADPLIGLGFGRPYTFYVPVSDLSADWPLWSSVPHNSVMWIWMDAGLFGFISLSVLFAAAVCRSMQLLRISATAMKPYAFACGAIVLMFVMYSWVDLGLITPRTLILFGLALGGIGTLGVMAESERPSR